MFEYLIEKLNETNYDETVILGTLLVILESNVDKYLEYFDSEVFGSNKRLFDEEFKPEFDGIFLDTERNIFTDVVKKMLLDNDIIVDMTFSFNDFTIDFNNRLETFQQKFINLAQVFYEMQFCGNKLTGVTGLTDLKRIREIMVIVENILMTKQKSLQVVYFNNKYFKNDDRMKPEEFPSSNVDFERVAAVKDLKKKVSVPTSSDIKHQIIILDDPKMEVDKINKLIELCNVDTVMILVGIGGTLTSTKDFVHIKKISPSAAPLSAAPSSAAPSIKAPISGGAVQNDVKTLKTKIIDALLSLYMYFLEKQGIKVIYENENERLMKGGSPANWLAFVLAIIFCIATISATNTSSPEVMNDALDDITTNPGQSVNLLFRNNLNAIKLAFKSVKYNRISSNTRATRLKSMFNNTTNFVDFLKPDILVPNVNGSDYTTALSDVARSLGETGGSVMQNIHLDNSKLQGLIENVNATVVTVADANTATTNAATPAKEKEILRLEEEKKADDEAANEKAADRDRQLRNEHVITATPATGAYEEDRD